MGGYVVSGVFKGNAVRKARKAGRCEYGVTAFGGERCKKMIEPGDHYVEGDPNPSKAGGFGQERWCLDHFSAGDIDTVGF